MRKPKLRVKQYPHSPSTPWVIEGLRTCEGKRKRLFFRTRAEADLELARIKVKHAREGQDALSIPDSLRIMARDCAERLGRLGHTIAEATDFYLAHLEAVEKSITVDALVQEYIEAKRRGGLSEVHLGDLRYRLGTFARDFSRARVRTLTSAVIEDWLHGLDLGPKSLNNFRDRLSTLCAYGVRRKYLDANPVAAIDPVKEVDNPPEIFTVDQLAAVLGLCSPELLPTLAIGAFAGLRTAELLRLSWTEVDLVRSYVEVTAGKSKTARRRLIPISDNLTEWLRPYAHHAGQAGQVCPLGAYHYHAACRATADMAGLSSWPKNGLRHSFASYYLALHQNAPELSLHLGHTSPQMVFNHYRELVHREEASRYWNIRPPVLAGNIVPLERVERNAVLS
jgi:integrase